MYLRGVVDRIDVPGNKIVAFCDTNLGRVAYYNRMLQELGQPKAAEYKDDQFEEMLEKEKVEVLVVTTMDATHHLYISEWKQTRAAELILAGWQSIHSSLYISSSF